MPSPRRAPTPTRVPQEASPTAPDVPSVPGVPSVPAVAPVPACPQTACNEQPTQSAATPMTPMTPLPSLPQLDQSAMEGSREQGVVRPTSGRSARSGYAKFTAQDFIELHSQGIDAARTVRALSRAGHRQPVGRPSWWAAAANRHRSRSTSPAREQTPHPSRPGRRRSREPAQPGVTPEYAGAFEWLGFRTCPSTISSRCASGLSPVRRRLRALGYRTMSIEDILKMQTQGVDLEWVAQIRAAGCCKPLGRRADRAAQPSGVDETSCSACGAATTMQYTVEDLVAAARARRRADYVSSLASSGCGGCRPRILRGSARPRRLRRGDRQGAAQGLLHGPEVGPVRSSIGGRATSATNRRSTSRCESKKYRIADEALKPQFYVRNRGQRWRPAGVFALSCRQPRTLAGPDARHDPRHAWTQ